MLIQMNCTEFNSRDLGSLHYHEHWLFRFIQSFWSPFEILLQTATTQGSNCYIRQPTHCLRDKYLARPLINKQTKIEGNYIPSSYAWSAY